MKFPNRAQEPTDSVDYTGTTVVITGASSGLGEVFADRFAARGANLVLVARREGRMTDLAARLETKYSVETTVIAQDLSAPNAARALVDRLEENNLRVDSLINNAGFGLFGDFLSMEPDKITQMIDLNVRFLTDLTRLLLPQLQASGRGVLVNIASTAAYQPLPGMAAYAASKAYVLSLTEALSYETKGTGLKVLALSPGPTKTEFFGNSEDAAVGQFQTADDVVDTALAELDRSNPRPSVISGKRNALTAAFAQILPRRVVLNATGKTSSD